MDAYFWMNVQVEESSLGNSGEGADDGSLESNKRLDHVVLLLADGLEAGSLARGLVFKIDTG